MDADFLSKSKSDLKDIFRFAVKAVLPNEIVRKNVKLSNNTLHVSDKSFPLGENVYLIGFGKAVMGMAIELESILGRVLKKGIVSIPSGSMDAIWTLKDKSGFPKLHNSAIEYREGGVDNQPDDRSLDTTHDIIDLAEMLTEADTLIVLVSGGGSALLYMPRPVLDREDKLELCKKLQNAGADIVELNTVRRKLSLVKGGGLARMAYPASTITLILSDIIGDPVDLIASGPTVRSAKAPEDVIAVLRKYNLFQSLEGDLKTVVTSKEIYDDGPLLNPAKQFKHVTNIVLGNNTMALQAASFRAACKKMTPIILGNDVRGDVRDVSLAYVHITSLICLALLNEIEKGEFYDKVRNVPILSLSIDKVDEIFRNIAGNLEEIVLIGGGEPTVKVTGQGKGGRNQELALRFSLDWLAKIKSYPKFAEYDVMMFSGGTDGQDGPTDAAGAFGYPAIAPTMHDLYAKVKSMAGGGAAQTLSRRKVASRFAARSDDESRVNNFDATGKSIAVEENINEYIDPLVLTTMEIERMLPENVLRENDTYNFYSRFNKGTDLLKTGFTGTNVMDLHFIYIKRRLCKCEIYLSDKPKYENNLDAHDLHIDASTVEKYKTIQDYLEFDKLLQDPVLPIKADEESLNIKIIDENFKDKCCDKKHELDENKEI